MVLNNFILDLHYDGNKAPFGLYFHGAWLKRDTNNVKLLKELYRYMGSKNNTVFATQKQIIQWMQNPIPYSQLYTRTEFNCPNPLPTTYYILNK